MNETASALSQQRPPLVRQKSRCIISNRVASNCAKCHERIDLTHVNPVDLKLLCDRCCPCNVLQGVRQ